MKKAAISGFRYIGTNKNKIVKKKNSQKVKKKKKVLNIAEKEARLKASNQIDKIIKTKSRKTQNLKGRE